MTQLHANELRSPCIVSSAEGVIGPITAEGIVEVQHSRFHAFGVPITPEWLERVGFVNPEKDANFFHRHAKAPFIVGYIEQDEFYETEVNQNIIVLKFLHQLQNLYLTLTGKELTIKL